MKVLPQMQNKKAQYNKDFFYYIRISFITIKKRHINCSVFGLDFSKACSSNFCCYFKGHRFVGLPGYKDSSQNKGKNQALKHTSNAGTSA